MLKIFPQKHHQRKQNCEGKYEKFKKNLFVEMKISKLIQQTCVHHIAKVLLLQGAHAKEATWYFGGYF
jgi:hypothetical protein